MMGKAALAKQRAIGQIGAARYDKLYDAGLVVVDAEEYERLTVRVAELERKNKLLRDIARDSAEINGIAAHILREGMSR